jgi:23S rRNA pseudouridine2605 synthase
MESTKDKNKKERKTASPDKERTNKQSTPKRNFSEKKSSYRKTEPKKTERNRRSRTDSFTEEKKDVSGKTFKNNRGKETGREKRITTTDTGDRKWDSQSTRTSRPSSRNRYDRDNTHKNNANTFEGGRREKSTFRRESGSDERNNYRRNDDGDFHTERRREDRPNNYRRNNDGDSRTGRRREDRPNNYRRNDDGDSRTGRRREDRPDNYRRNDDDNTFREKRNYERGDRKKEIDAKSQKKRVSTILDSEIMREIIQKRRDTGRLSHKPKVLSLAWSEERGPVRLNKYIANSGICSRREADNLIVAGAITVNGEVVTELGTKVMPVDEVRYEDKLLQREKPVYILLNKPKGFITTTEDERGRDNVMMLIEGACSQRVYPVGRLDRDTTGLLLFTNDGEMTKKLTHPRHGIKKIYQVELETDMSLADFETLANGIELSDGLMQPDDLAFVDDQKNVLGIVLHSGRNRVVRRLFEHLGYEIKKLDRVYYAGLTKKDLPRGTWRFLRQEEINILKRSL